MNAKQQFVKQLKPHHFWDINMSEIDDVINKRLIIERIINLGSLSEIDAIIKHYGITEVIKAIRELSFLDPKTLNFISKLFDVPKNTFRCSTGNPLKKKHWNS